MEHGKRLHSIYGASSGYRRKLCPGSVKQSLTAPASVPTKWSIDGTEAHELLDYALKNGYRNAREASIMAGRYELDTKLEAGERFVAVDVCLDYVWDIMDTYEDAVLYVEHPFTMPSLVTNEGWGTNDICIYIPSLSLVYVIDYKHGAGKGVDHRENFQLLQYGTGAVLGSGHIDAETIALVIIQPRCFHPEGPIRPWIVTRARLEAFVEEFDANVLLCESPDAPLVPGEVQCWQCPAALTCPAREAKALQVVSSTFRTVKDITKAALPEPASLPLDRIAYIMAAKSFLIDWLNEVDQIAYSHAMSGAYVPDHKLVEARASAKWFGDADDIARDLMLLAGTEDWDAFYPRKLITITEAREKMTAAYKSRVKRADRKKAAEEALEAVAGLTLKETSGNLTLVHISDTRPAVNRAATAFTSVQVLPPPTQG